MRLGTKARPSRAGWAFRAIGAVGGGFTPSALAADDTARLERAALTAIHHVGWPCRRIEQSALGETAAGYQYLTVKCSDGPSYLAKVRLGWADRATASPCYLAPVAFQRKCWAKGQGR